MFKSYFVLELTKEIGLTESYKMLVTSKFNWFIYYSEIKFQQASVQPLLILILVFSPIHHIVSTYICMTPVVSYPSFWKLIASSICDFESLLSDIHSRKTNMKKLLG